jgi:hypothetical protein
VISLSNDCAGQQLKLAHHSGGCGQYTEVLLIRY